MRKPYPTDLSDAEWNYIQPHLPAPKGHGRPRTHDLRKILDAVFYVLKSGCQWRLYRSGLLMSQRLHRLHPPRVSGELFEERGVFPVGCKRPGERLLHQGDALEG